MEVLACLTLNVRTVMVLARLHARIVMEKDISNKIMTIDYLTQQLHKTLANTNANTTINLLDFN